MIATVAALLVSQLTVSPGAFGPEGPPAIQKTWQLWGGTWETSFIKPEDCSQPWRIGGKDSALCDISPALKRVIAACTEHLTNTAWEVNARTGCVIEIPPGEMAMSEEIRLCRGHRIWGHGSANWGTPSRIFIPKTQSAFRAAYFHECMAAGEGGGAQGLVIEGLAFRELTGAAVHTSVNYAIRIEANAVTVRNVWSRGFVRGIEIVGDVTRTPGTNASLWHLEDVQIDGTLGAGLLIDGGDANGGYAERVDVHTACERGSSWKHNGHCAPFHVSDYLGSTFVATHATGSKDKVTGEQFANYVFEDLDENGLPKNGQRGVLIGPYSESDVKSNILSANTIAIGGAGGGLNTLGGWEGGLRLVGPKANSLIITNDLNPLAITETKFGRATNLGGVAMQLRMPSGHPVMRQPVNFVIDPQGKRLRVNVAGITQGDALTIGMTSDAPWGGYGALNLPKLPIHAGASSWVRTSTVSP